MDPSRHDDFSSAWQMTRRLLDREQINAAKIPPLTFYMLLEGIAESNDRAFERSNVFAPIADLMTGTDSFHIQIRVPKKMTVYDGGLSPATKAMHTHIATRQSGVRLCEGMPGLWSENEQEYLLLLVPQENRSLCWAKWTAGYTLRKTGEGAEISFERTATHSRVCWFEREDVLAIFRERPGIIYHLLDRIGMKLHDSEKELQALCELRRYVDDIKYRIRIS